ncbi:hypothetical protein NE237_014432 [Protea cynaroides]|uniref:Uncharacterized protein n=1 Tax=Protea cynaroides TaxID=273540 RepID=A0A9Q0KCA9_9MAGN|nr:hypothetical protein NE237_014432 [Protea cynaroides]
MASWVRTITSPFRKACTFFNNNRRDNKSQPGHGHDNRITDLQDEVMACGYEDVQVMWSILDNSKPRVCKGASLFRDLLQECNYSNSDDLHHCKFDDETSMMPKLCKFPVINKNIHGYIKIKITNYGCCHCCTDQCNKAS